MIRLLLIAFLFVPWAHSDQKSANESRKWIGIDYKKVPGFEKRVSGSLLGDVYTLSYTDKVALIVNDNEKVKDALIYPSIGENQYFSDPGDNFACRFENQSVLAVIDKENARKHLTFVPKNGWAIHKQRGEFVRLTSEEIKETVCSWNQACEEEFPFTSTGVEKESKEISQCSRAEQKLFEDVNDSISKSFNLYKKFYNSYSWCEKYGFGSGIQISLANSFLYSWSRLENFKTSLKDKGFRSFVLSHMQDFQSFWKDRLKQIIAKSINECPDDMGPFCSSLRKSVRAAIIKIESKKK